MVIYLIKSGLCLALLLAFYHIVLEREKMHTFNRFYLLGSVLFSFLAPLYVIYISAAPVVTETFTPILQEDLVAPIDNVEVVNPINYWFYFIVFYVAIALLFLIRFSKNLFSIFRKISIHKKVKIEKATLVLVEDNIAPHTFWNYIFINKDDYFNEKLESELYTHELTHATQKHTFDVLLLEILLIVFWINPVVYLLKKAVKLNHEFLADTKVIDTYKNIIAYQYLLLNKSRKNEYYLASNLNYLLTKKRLQMMTKETKKRVVWLKKLAIIPVLIGAIFLFAERVEAQEIIEVVEEPQNVQKNQETSTTKLPNGEVIEIVEDKPPILKIDLNNNKYYLNNRLIKLNKLKEEFLKETNGIPSNLSIDAEDKIPMSFINRVKKEITIEFLDNIILTNKESYIYDENSKKLNSTPKIIHYNSKFVDSPIKKKSSKQSIKNEKTLKDIKLKLKDVDALKKSINKKDTIKPISVKYTKLSASNSEMKEYKAILEKGKKDRLFTHKDILKMGHLYKIMSKEQKNSVENYGRFIPPPPPPRKVKKGKKSNIPPPPPPPSIPKKVNTKKGVEKGWLHVNNQTIFYVKKDGKTEYFNRWGNLVDENGKIINIKNKQKTSSNNNTSQKKGWEVDYKVNVVDNKTGKVNTEQLKSEDYFEYQEKLKKVKKNYYLDDKKISKENYYNLIKSDKDYLIGSSYANKEKSLLNMYISKSKEYIENIIKKNH